ncbi:MAG: hypothetical protein WC713_11780 [Candidatus Methylomirabilota bacterium]
MKTKNVAMKQKPAATLTRVELAQTLGLGLSSIDRLIAFGLPSVGTRGRAKTYRLTAARRLAQRLSRVQPEAEGILLTDYRTHAEDLHDRRRALLETWIPLTAWTPAYRRFVAMIARQTAPWPETITARLAGLTREATLQIAAAESSATPTREPRRYLPPHELAAMLASDPPAAPLLPAACPALHKLVAAGQGITLYASGAWFPWDPSAGIPADPVEVVPLLRPLLTALAEHVGICREARALAAALEIPAPDPLPPTPTTVDEARQHWREARFRYRQTRVAIRRGHHRRAEILNAIHATLTGVRLTWWGSWPDFLAAGGDSARLQLAVQAIRERTMHDLHTLGGILRPIPTGAAGDERSLGCHIRN